MGEWSDGIWKKAIAGMCQAMGKEVELIEVIARARGGMKSYEIGDETSE